MARGRIPSWFANIDGQLVSVAEMARRSGLRVKTIRSRMRAGITGDALIAPLVPRAQRRHARIGRPPTTPKAPPPPPAATARAAPNIEPLVRLWVRSVFPGLAA